MRLKKKFIIGWILAGLIILSFFVGRCFEWVRSTRV